MILFYFLDPIPPNKTNMVAWKIHHEWRFVFPMENGGFPALPWFVFGCVTVQLGTETFERLSKNQGHELKYTVICCLGAEWDVRNFFSRAFVHQIAQCFLLYMLFIHIFFIFIQHGMHIYIYSKPILRYYMFRKMHILHMPCAVFWNPLY